MDGVSRYLASSGQGFSESEFFAWLQTHSSSELGYVVLIVVLFVVPRFLLKVGVPMALSAFAVGVATSFGFSFYDEDNVVSIFSTLGIVSLFLFAGLEVNLASLRLALRPILGHIGFRILVVLTLAIVTLQIYSLPLVSAIVLALALATPSTGFILDSIDSSNISEKQKFWIKLKAISAELVALGGLLVFSQMDSAAGLATSLLIVGLLIVVLPLFLKKLALTLEKFAPGSEFSFILMLAIICGIITKKIGAYYLVGAFLVGMIAARYKQQSPSASSDQILHSLRSFSAFFMPFYFFNSGLKMPHQAFSMESLNIAMLLLLISGPIKIGSIVLHRRLSIIEPWKDSLSISISLMPNLVFGLVLADILKNKMNLSVPIYGGLVIYTLSVTVLTPILLKLIGQNKDIEAAVSAEPLVLPVESREN